MKLKNKINKKIIQVSFSVYLTTYFYLLSFLKFFSNKIKFNPNFHNIIHSIF